MEREWDRWTRTRQVEAVSAPATHCRPTRTTPVRSSCQSVNEEQLQSIRIKLKYATSILRIKSKVVFMIGLFG